MIRPDNQLPLAVDRIEMPDNNATDYYTLQGVKIKAPQNGEVVIERKNGKSVKKVTYI